MTIDDDAGGTASTRSGRPSLALPLPPRGRAACAFSRGARYRERLEGSLAAVAGGDLGMMAHPVRDSYHTVWFELHEELIRLTGRNRADEAAAGRV